MLNEVTSKWIIENINTISWIFITLLVGSLYSMISSIAKKLPKALYAFGQLKIIDAAKALFFYVLPLFFIIGFIITFRNKVVEFGILGLFIVFCSMYLMVIFLTIINNVLRVSLKDIKNTKELLTSMDSSLEELNKNLEGITQKLENK